MDNEKYLRSHPEVECLISGFLRYIFIVPNKLQTFSSRMKRVNLICTVSHTHPALFCRDILLKRPENVRDFAAGKYLTR